MADRAGRADSTDRAGRGERADRAARPRAGGHVAIFLTVAAVLVAVMVGVWAVGERGDAGDPDHSAAPVSPSPSVSAGTAATVPTTATVPTAARSTYEAACGGGLDRAMGPPATDPALTEVSGIAVDPAGVAWVLNDSGDQPRIFGLRSDGSVQTVDVAGADAVDWEDVAVQHSGDRSVLWIADTGSNIEPRSTVQLYRVPVPGPGESSVVADRLDVTYPDGSHDVEALVVEPSGQLVLITKEPGSPALYRVEPSPTGSATAQAVGSFELGDASTMVTSADLSSDGSTLVLRTYLAVYLVPIAPDQSLIDALRAADRHCLGLLPFELQGEAIGFLPDGSGYVSMGEGADPVLTTVTAG